MKKILFAFFAAALIVAVSCEKKETTPVLPENTPQEITFKANIYTFTKATDTAFENSDAIGVSIFNPEVYIFNKEFTYNEGKFSSSVAHKWYEDRNLESTITAVYPYNGSIAEYNSAVVFQVSENQAVKAGYAASDLMVAKTTAKPTAEAVQLPFKHALSKIEVKINSQLSEDIADVYFVDVNTEVTYDPKDPANLTTTETKGTVKAYKTGDDTWGLIVAPMKEASPKLAIVTVSGKQYSFELTENVTFSSGKISTAEVTVKEESIYTSFTSSIEDWITENVLDFSESEEEVEIPEPSVPATRLIYLNPQMWSSDSPRFEAYFFETGETWVTMTDPDSDGIYECEIPDGATKVIFTRMDPSKPEGIWDSKWNQTEDLIIPDNENCFTINAWDGGEKGESLGTWSIL